MSVIGYVIVCDLCNAKMLVTADFKHGKFCPDCLDDYISEAIEDAIRDEETIDVDGPTTRPPDRRPARRRPIDDYDEVPPWQIYYYEDTIENGDNNA
jgi:hypothetical protein